jgi:glutathione S-transferase
MKLYYAQGTCSHAPHIALREAGLDFTLVRYDMKRATLESGQPLTTIHEKGYVPVLELAGGERLTEAAVVLQYIADRVPERGLAPPAGTMERYRLMEWLNFLATEVHKIYWPLFHDGAEIENQKAREKLGRSFGFIERRLGERPFVPIGLESGFTVADAYLVTLLNWAKPGGIDLGAWPKLKAYRSRIRDRPAVVAALEAEGMRR